ncbi:MAG: glycosyltransferase family 4 protein [Acidimicrobiia bacterium]
MPDEKVLYVLKRFPRLSETFILRELLELEATGARIVIDALLEPEPGPRHPELDRLKAPVRYVARRPRLVQPSVFAAHVAVAGRAPWRWLQLALRARREGTWRRFVQAGLVARRIRREQVSHVHAHFATAAASVARDAAALAGIRVSVTAHAKDIFHTDNAPHLARRLHGVDTIVTVSEYNVRHLRSVCDGADVRYIPNGVALPEPVLPVASGPVLCVSRLVPKKGIDTLIEAVAKVAAAKPGVTLDVVGGGPLMEALRERAGELGVDQNVRLHGPKTSIEVDAAYRACSMVVLPCRIDESGDRDGLPTVLVEAMARGIPVISTDIVGIPELVRDGDTGLLVAPDDPSALAAAMERLIDDPELARRLGTAARAHVRSQYEPAASASALRRVFEGVR